MGLSLRTRNTLVEENRNLVRKVAHEYAKSCREPFEDLEQVGYLGFIQALDRFDTKRGLTVSTFAVPYIRGAILHYLRDKSRLVRVPRPWQDNFHAVRREASRQLTSNRNPEIQAVKKLGIDLIDWTTIVQAMNGSCLPINERAIDTITHKFSDYEASSPQIEQISIALTKLEPLRRKVLLYIYVEEMNLREVARALSLKQKDLQSILSQTVALVRRMVNHEKIELHPEFLSGKSGEKLFAVLPYDEFLAVRQAVEDLEIITDLRLTKFQEVLKTFTLLQKAIADMESVTGSVV